MVFSSEDLVSSAQLQAQLEEKDTIIFLLTQQLALQSDKTESQAEKIQYLTGEVQSQARQIALLQEMLRCLKLKLFAASSEKTASKLSLFDEAELLTDPDVLAVEEKIQETQETTKKAPTKKPGRKPLSADLLRVQIFLHLSEEEKAGAKSTFFTKIKEELDFVPATFQVLEYMQEKAVFEQDEKQKIIAAAQPKHPIPGVLGSINLITYAITSKYVDGLPLYRIEKQLERCGGNLSRATLASYIIKSSRVFQPIINLLLEHQHTGDIIAMDETRIQVLKEPDKPVTSDKYMWVSLGGLPDKQSVLFHYEASRGSQIPLSRLDGFHGYLQTDGYAGYNAACEKYKLIRVGCMDHARRKFKDAQKAQPKVKNAKPSKADMALSLINKLYVVERQIVALKLKGDEVVAYRQQHSKPLLDKIKLFLDANVDKVPKDSLVGRAIRYMLNQWERLNVYCTHSELRISNIMAENAIRPFTVGRKAWLFADTPSGARASAICYSIVETAKLHGLEPSYYIHTLLAKLPYAKTVEDIEELLPWNIKKFES